MSRPTSRVWAAAAVLVLVAAARVVAFQEDPRTEKSRTEVDKWLAGIPGLKGGMVGAVGDEFVLRVFPEDRFFSVRFMRYPRAQFVPRPLKLENLVWVKADGSVERLVEQPEQGAATLTDLFRARARAVTEENELRDEVMAGLRLAEEFHQDGQYLFSASKGAVSLSREGDRRVALGNALVTKGGTGQVTLTLTVDGAGRVVDAVSSGQVRPDVRLR